MATNDDAKRDDKNCQHPKLSWDLTFGRGVCTRCGEFFKAESLIPSAEQQRIQRADLGRMYNEHVSLFGEKKHYVAQSPVAPPGVAEICPEPPRYTASDRAAPSSEGTVTPEAFDLPHLEGPTPCTDELVNVKFGRTLALDPAYHYVRPLIEFTKAMERLFWRERKSNHGMMKLLAQARSSSNKPRTMRTGETPRTDAKAYTPFADDTNNQVVNADFARQLERELAHEIELRIADREQTERFGRDNVALQELLNIARSASAPRKEGDGNG